MTTSERTTVEEWWGALGTTALLGTGRRGVPSAPGAVPGRDSASPQAALLDAAALGGALVRAGRTLPTAAPAPVAEPDRLPVAPVQAIQLLELVLIQTPGGADLRETALNHWLTCANDVGRRVPARLLPQLLDQVLSRPDLHRAALIAADARGAWLVAQRRKWRPLTTSAQAATADVHDPTTWAQQPTAARAEALTQARQADPAAARELLESVWTSEKAGDRAVLLATLATGLSLADDPFLEQALDDRSAVVRKQAQDLLDALPGSARAQRLGDLLRPLITVAGLLRRTLEVELPTDPDAAAKRDGLDQGPKSRSQRGYWMERLATGAPLAVWTEATGKSPADTWRLITDSDARMGIVRAVLARRDPVWASAVVEDVQLADLLTILPPADREAAALRRLGGDKRPAGIVQQLSAIPGPWSLHLSRTVLAHLASNERELSLAVPTLAACLPVSILPELQRLPDTLSRPRNQLVQHLSLIQAITEAFQ